MIFHQNPHQLLNGNKSNLRAEFLTKRKQLSAKVVQEQSQLTTMVLTNFLTTIPFTKIAFYLPIQNEIDLTSAIISQLQLQKQIYIPRFLTQTSTYEMAQISNLDTDLILGKYKVREANKNIPTLFDVSKIEIWLVPGIVFDQQGHRIGFGKGYYDKLLANSSQNSIKIGIAYPWQVLDQIPFNSTDISMTTLITDCIFKITDY